MKQHVLFRQCLGTSKRQVRFPLSFLKKEPCVRFLFLRLSSTRSEIVFEFVIRGWNQVNTER